MGEISRDLISRQHSLSDSDSDTNWEVGRAGLVLLLKAIVEDEVKPLPARQDEVVRELRKMSEEHPESFELVMPLYKGADGARAPSNLRHVRSTA